MCCMLVALKATFLSETLVECFKSESEFCNKILLACVKPWF
jgi:hypothetical protein